jgi:hypothetical protein
MQYPTDIRPRRHIDARTAVSASFTVLTPVQSPWLTANDQGLVLHTSFIPFFLSFHLATRYTCEYIYGSLYGRRSFPSFPHPVLDLVLRTIHRLRITLPSIDRPWISYPTDNDLFSHFRPSITSSLSATDPSSPILPLSCRNVTLFSLTVVLNLTARGPIIRHLPTLLRPRFHGIRKPST